tara:strand:- start:2219 stop:5026 length:2808 start_codon:yes stop_codon:yes gene_type:complete
MSYNSLFGRGKHDADASLIGHWLGQDAASGTTVTAETGGNIIFNTTLKTGGGPNSTYLTSGIRTWGTTDFGEDSIASNSSNHWTALSYVKADTSTSGTPIGVGGSTFDKWVISPFIRSDGFGVSTRSVGGSVASASLNTSVGTGWNHLAATVSPTELRAVLNGTDTASASGSYIIEDGTVIGMSTYLTANGSSQYRRLDGTVADSAVFSRVLADAEMEEHRLGPEPLNLTAPTVSGTGESGQTLSAFNGTWDSQDNGTVTSTLQWYRGRDAIPGATGSSYMLTNSDRGHDVYVKETASNDGGHDPLEVTSSNRIYVERANSDDDGGSFRVKLLSPQRPTTRKLGDGLVFYAPVWDTDYPGTVYEYTTGRTSYGYTTWQPKTYRSSSKPIKNFPGRSPYLGATNSQYGAYGFSGMPVSGPNSAFVSPSEWHTVSAWFDATHTSSSNQYLLQIGEGTVGRAVLAKPANSSSDMRIFFEKSTGSFSGTTSDDILNERDPSDGGWVHVSLSYKLPSDATAAQVKWYVNGRLYETKSVSGAGGWNVDTSGVINVANSASMNRTWKAPFAELRVYNRELSPAEHAGLYAAMANPSLLTDEYVVAGYSESGGGATIVSPAESTHGVPTGSPILTQDHSLVSSGALHGHEASQSGVSVEAEASPENALHSIATDEPSVDVGAFLGPLGASHGITDDGVTLGVESGVDSLGASHSHDAGQPTLEAEAGVSPGESLHSHTSDSAVLSVGSFVSADSSTQDITDDGVTLGVESNLDTSGAAHSHAADQPPLVVTANTLAASALHSHLADEPSLAVTSSTSAEDSLHSISTDEASLNIEATVLPTAASQPHSSDSTSLDVTSSVFTEGATHALSSSEAQAGAGVFVTPGKSTQLSLVDSPDTTTVNVVIVNESSHAMTSADAFFAVPRSLTFIINGTSKTRTFGRLM